MAGTDKKSVLFVCLGNICRSPMAEAVFRHLVKERGLSDKWTIDSAATSTWEIGRSPDKRGQKLLKSKNIPVKHIARQVTKADFTTFDFIFGMDEDNMSNLQRMAPKGATAKMMMLGSYDPEGQEVIEDPYYDGPEAFDVIFVQVSRCCKAFLDKQNN